MFVLGTFTAFAGEKTEKFKMYGNWGMCEKRIEKADNSVDGVQSADWNKPIFYNKCYTSVKYFFIFVTYCIGRINISLK
jgi:hypothetical protein